MKTKNNTLSTTEDIILSPLGAIFGYFFGNVYAWIHPLAIPNQINRIRNEGVKHFSSFTKEMGTLAGYLNQTYEISSNITEESNNLTNYIPVITNLLIGTGLLIHKIKTRNEINYTKKLEEIVNNTPINSS